MRILIGNHIDESLLWQKDQRGFAQRIFWFAEDGDMVILSHPPDAVFLAHVAELTGLDISSLRVLVLPLGRSMGRHFEPDLLCEVSFVEQVKDRLQPSDVSEVFALWPSAQVAEFVARLGLTSALPGARFFAQQGDELANNKGNFRAFAAATGTPIADGAVCRTRTHAAQVLKRLLEAGPVMVKQVHNGAGLGNQLLWPADTNPVAQPGAAHRYHLGPETDAVERYLDERWSWASVDERFPVVIERFVPRARTIYAEFLATDGGVKHTECGSLGFKDGRLVEETVPLRTVSLATRERLIDMGHALAKTYHAFGYRGPLSADAVIEDDGHITFTEMNARVGGSLHLYEGIGRRVVDLRRSPKRALVQYVTGRWRLQSVEHFLQCVQDLQLGYDRSSRKGVIAAMPLAGEPGTGGLLFCVAFEEAAEAAQAYRCLAEELA